MSHTDQKRDCMSHSLTPSEISRIWIFCKELLNIRIGPFFKFGCRDPRTAEFVSIFEKRMQGSVERRIGPFLIGKQGSTNRQFGRHFEIEMQGFMDRRVDPYF